ncbi:MAG: hypothetical protein HQK55_00530 [Deltaproteobacteria bacterium]|nr:hypothetical protein [Deltaproteobacteria bacterium]
MHVHRVKSRQRGKVYEQILLRESYREPGQARKTLLNLTNYPANEIEAIEMALKHKNKLPALEKLIGRQIMLKQGASVGAVWVLHRLCQNIGFHKDPRNSRNPLLCLRMILARLFNQGSGLSAVSLAWEHAASEIISLPDFDVNELYNTLDWLSDHKMELKKSCTIGKIGSQYQACFYMSDLLLPVG